MACCYVSSTLNNIALLVYECMLLHCWNTKGSHNSLRSKIRPLTLHMRHKEMISIVCKNEQRCRLRYLRYEDDSSGWDGHFLPFVYPKIPRHQPLNGRPHCELRAVLRKSLPGREIHPDVADENRREIDLKFTTRIRSVRP